MNAIAAALGDTASGADVLRRSLTPWYQIHGRHDLPWRLTRDPYAVLVSEVMLQQTQVSRVLPYYATWLERWATFAALAAESPAEVIRAWGGLGYNRRGLALHRLAVEVTAGDGHLTRDVSELRKLPGIGPYTASAVASFAFEQPVAVVDTNIARVIARSVFGAASAKGVGSGLIEAEAGRLLPESGARDHNLALMDLGAMVCRARVPDCPACPLKETCAWRRAGFPPGSEGSVTSPRFQTTARFARGRIVDALRSTATLDESKLAARLPEEHAPNVAVHLAALERDGMVERSGEGWSLPGGYGSTSIASPKL